VGAGGLRYRALILLAAFSSLRWGELAALRPEDIDLDASSTSPVLCRCSGLRSHALAAASLTSQT
jgi:hypothetical protein